MTVSQYDQDILWEPDEPARGGGGRDRVAARRRPGARRVRRGDHAARRRRRDRRGRGHRRSSLAIPDVSGDPYLDPRSGVFRNRLGLTDRVALSAAEVKLSSVRDRPVQAPPPAGPVRPRPPARLPLDDLPGRLPVGRAAAHRAHREGRRLVLPAPPDHLHRRGDLRSPRRGRPPARPRPGRLPRRPHRRCSPTSTPCTPFARATAVPSAPSSSSSLATPGYRLRWEHVDRDANIDAARAAADGDLGPMRALLDPVVRARRHGGETSGRRSSRRSCGGGGASRPGGGGGGIESTPGASPGQTSSTGHGAWSTTNRVAGPRLRGPSRLAVAVARADQQVGALGGRHHLALDPAGALLGRRAGRPSRSAAPLQQVRRRPRRTARRAAPPGRAGRPRPSRPGQRAVRGRDLAARTCSSTTSSPSGTQAAGRVDARRPRPLRHPHDRLSGHASASRDRQHRPQRHGRAEQRRRHGQQPDAGELAELRVVVVLAAGSAATAGWPASPT